MKVLAWDTSSKAGVVVAVEWSEGPLSEVKLVSQFALNVDATHSERLLWAIHQILVSARWSLEEVDAFAVGSGPGSFTGLRIGVTTARTLAHTLGKPLIPLSSLAALARPVAQHFSAGSEKVLVIAATDACKGELFALWGEAQEVQRYGVPGDLPGFTVGSQNVREAVVSPDQFLQSILPVLQSSDTELKWAVVGEALQRYPDLWEHLPHERRRIFPFPFANQVEGRSLGLMAWEAWQIQKRWHPLNVYPRYLRASDAELKLRAGLLPSLRPR